MWGDLYMQLKYSRGSGLFQCPGCFKWLKHESFVSHHISYEPEKTIIVCRKCHAGIHKEKDSKKERDDWLKKKKEEADKKREERRPTNEKLLSDKAFRKKYRQKKSGRGKGWGVLR